MLSSIPGAKASQNKGLGTWWRREVIEVNDEEVDDEEVGDEESEDVRLQIGRRILKRAERSATNVGTRVRTLSCSAVGWTFTFM